MKKAVIESGSKQYIVSEGDSISIEKLDVAENGNVTFDKVLLVHDGAKTTLGSPYIDNLSVSGTVVKQERDNKIIVFKFKRKTGQKTTRGHKQHLTTIKIDSIGGAPAKKESVKKTENKAASKDDEKAKETKKTTTTSSKSTKKATKKDKE